MIEQIQKKLIDVVLVDKSSDDLEALKSASHQAGVQVVAAFSSVEELVCNIDDCETDAILIKAQPPVLETLKHIEHMLQKRAQPVVMFSDDDDSELIQCAMQIGVSSYIVDSFKISRIRSIVDVAIARFECLKQLETELAKSKEELVQRKHVDRAKGLLMDQYGISESKAYGMMRKAAMDSNLKIFDVASSIIQSATSHK